MKKRTEKLILIIIGTQIVVIIGLLVLPSVARAIPGRYRVALQERSPFVSGLVEGVIDQVAPAPTALPTAQLLPDREEVDIAALIADEPTLIPIPTAEPTDAPLQSEETAVTNTPAAEPTATLEPTPTPEPTPVPLPVSHVLEGIGAVKQTFNNCGPANLTQVLNFHGSDLTQAQVASYLKPNNEDRNVSPWQIADYVNERTAGQFLATVHSGGTLELLKQFIAAGLPVVVEKGYELPQSGWWGHYLTVYGYDDQTQLFNTQDSYLGPWDGSGRTISYQEMDRFWQQFNYTFYVVYQPHQEQLVFDILGPDLLDQMTMWRQAAARAQDEVKAEPDNAFAWFNLGTNLTEMGIRTGEAEFYQGGAQAFDRARELGLPARMLWYQFRPYVAYTKVGRYDDVVALADITLSTQGGQNVEETYWYKGIAQEFLGDISGAIANYETSLARNANFYPAEISLNALTGG